MRGIALLSLILLAGCGQTTNNRRTNDGHKPVGPRELTFTYEVGKKGDLVEGELATINIRVTNGTEKYVLLYDLVPTDGSPRIRWQQSRAGAIDYIRHLDEYMYASRVRDRTEPIFNIGLLAPQEAITFHLRMRLLTMPKAFTLRYKTFTLSGIAREIYIYIGSIQKVHRFRRLLIEEEIREKLIPMANPNKSSHRAVLFPHWMDAEFESRVELIQIRVRKRAFTLEEAGKKVPELKNLKERPATTYFSKFESWVIQTKKRAWLISPASVSIVGVAKSPSAFYHFLDASATSKWEVEFRDETKTLFGDDFRLIRHLRLGRYRWIAFLKQADLIKLLEKVGETGLKLDVEWGRPAGRILVVKD